MKNIALLAVPLLCLSVVALASARKPKKFLVGAAAGGQFGQPGQLPGAVIDPGAPPSANSWIEDGGSGPKPPVVRVPIEASAIYIGTTQGGTGIVSAISGYDGGFPLGVIYEELWAVTSPGGAVAVNTNRTFTPADGGVGLANAICSCTPIVCAGLGGCYATACNMTADGGVSQANITSDGGQWLVDCKGY